MEIAFDDAADSFTAVTGTVASLSPTAALLRFDDGRLQLATTSTAMDRFLVATVDSGVSVDDPADATGIHPKKFATAAKEALESGATITLDDGHFVFRNGGLELKARALSDESVRQDLHSTVTKNQTGEFVDGLTHHTAIDTSLLKDVLSQMKVWDDSPTMRLDVDRDGITASAENVERRIDADDFSEYAVDGSFTTRFQPSRVKEVLTGIAADDCIMRLGGEDAPMAVIERGEHITVRSGITPVIPE